MNRDEEVEPTLKRPPVDEEVGSEPPVAPDSQENVRRPELPSRPRTGAGAWQPPTDQMSPLKVPSGVLNRNVPSHPSWEKAPSPYLYPRLRGQEKRQTLKPLLFAAIGVALILGVVVVLPALTGRKSNAPVAAGSASPSANVSNQPLQSAAPSPSVGSGGTPLPFASYQQYPVGTGDTLLKIAKKFHLQSWELLLANPQITDPNNVKLRSVLNIPRPGQLTPPPQGASPTALPTASAAASVVAP